MKRLLLAALLVAGCEPYFKPHIDSFTVDDANPPAGKVVHLSYSVRGADIVSIVPEPGEVTGSPVAVTPRGTTIYTLRAANPIGESKQDVMVTLQTDAAASITSFRLTPSQAPAGAQRTLTWNIKNGVSMILIGGDLGTVPIHSVGGLTVAPLVTTTYTLIATSGRAFTPPQVQGMAVARVVEPTAIAWFTATPPAILQGDAVTLRWDGSALSWSIAAGPTTTNLGVARLLLVRPAATTTYSLTGSGPGGAAGQQLTVTVTPRAGTKLVYTPPPSGSERLRLVADACPAPCTTITLRLLAAAPVGLRGVAIDLPLDASKVSLDPLTFSSALDAGKAVLGTGPLAGQLVLGAVKKGTGAAPAADKSLMGGEELAHFSVALQSLGGQGVVFDGAQAFTSFIQSASGRTPGGIAVGKLEAK